MTLNSSFTYLLPIYYEKLDSSNYKINEDQMSFNFKNKGQKIQQAAHYVSAKRHISKLYWYLLLLLILTPFLYLGYKIFTYTFIKTG